MGLNKVVGSGICAVSSLLALGAAPAALGQESHGSDTGTIREVREFRVVLPFENVPRAITTEVVDDVVVYEGDIVLGTTRELERRRSIIIDGNRYRWPSSIIPYFLPANHPQRTRIEAAIRMVEQTTNLCMVPRTTQTAYVAFVDGSGCSSSVGRQGRAQNITIGSCSTGSVVHEIFHSAGLYHEQSREDRNAFITVHLENVEPGKEHNFDRRVSNATDFAAYDYGSIMHYGATAFSINGLPTITVNPQPDGLMPLIGQRTEPSPTDIAAINTLYAENTTPVCLR